MIEHAALPEDTIISIGEAPNVVEAQRFDAGWYEVNPHCVDCGAEWSPDGTPKKWNAGERSLDLANATVTHVPAEWLTARLDEAFTTLGEDGSADAMGLIAQIALDAGLDS